jgi:hypothetical protein
VWVSESGKDGKMKLRGWHPRSIRNNKQENEKWNDVIYADGLSISGNILNQVRGRERKQAKIKTAWKDSLQVIIRNATYFPKDFSHFPPLIWIFIANVCQILKAKRVWRRFRMRWLQMRRWGMEEGEGDVRMRYNDMLRSIHSLSGKMILVT